MAPANSVDPKATSVLRFFAFHSLIRASCTQWKPIWRWHEHCDAFTITFMLSPRYLQNTNAISSHLQFA